MATSEITQPALVDILRTLKRQPMSIVGIRKWTGQSQTAIRAYLTRLLFLGAVSSRGGKYTLTLKGQAVVASVALSAAQELLAAGPLSVQGVMGVLRKAGIPLSRHGSVKRHTRGVERHGINVTKVGRAIAIQHSDIDEGELRKAVGALLAAGMRVKSPITSRILSGDDRITDKELSGGLLLVANGIVTAAAGALDAKSYATPDVPKHFYMVTELPETSDRWEQLAKGKLEGVAGVSGSSLIMVYFHAIGDTILKIPGQALVEANKVSRVLYEKPEYLASKGLEAVYRIANADTDTPTGHFAVADRLFSLFFGGGNRAAADALQKELASGKEYGAKWSSEYGFLRELYFNSDALQQVAKQLEKGRAQVRSVKDLARILKKGVESIDAYDLSKLRSRGDASDALYYRMAEWGLRDFGKKFKSEAEWRTKKGVLNLPEGTIIYRYEGNSKNYLLDELGISKRYKVVMLDRAKFQKAMTSREIREALKKAANLAAGKELKAAEVLGGEIFTDESGKFWGNAGAGGLFYAKDTGRVLVQKRSSQVNEPNTWGVWGGAIDDGEDPSHALRREVTEEAGYRGHFELDLVYVFKDAKFRYHNYLIIVPEEFEPKHGWESSDHVWTDIDDLPSPLHFGLKKALPHYKKSVAERQKKLQKTNRSQPAARVRGRIQRPPRNLLAQFKIALVAAGKLNKLIDMSGMKEALSDQGIDLDYNVSVALEKYVEGADLLLSDYEKVLDETEKELSISPFKVVEMTALREFSGMSYRHQEAMKASARLTKSLNEVLKELEDEVDLTWRPEDNAKAYALIKLFQTQVPALISKMDLQEVQKQIEQAKKSAEDIPTHEDVETLYHASINAVDIGRNGFSEKVPNEGGLGGSQATRTGEKGISFTHDLHAAKEISRALKEAVMIMHGAYTGEQLVRHIKAERGTWDKLLNHMNSVDGERATSEFLKKLDDPKMVFWLYKKYLQQSRYRFDPIFFASSTKAFKSANLRNVGIVVAKVNMDHPSVSFHGGEKEVRAAPAAVIEIEKVIK